MAGGSVPSGPPTMSSATAAIFIFNLIVGTGALALPAAFASAGWLLGTILLVFLALTSYMTATWVIEAISACNGIMKVEESLKVHTLNEEDEVDEEEKNFFDSESDREYLVRTDLRGQLDVPSYGATHREHKTVCNLSRQLELATMADLLFNKTGKLLFCICMILYLYGDLAIYCTAVAKSFRDVTCTQPEGNYSSNATDLCWSSLSVSRHSAYRIYVALFVALLGPFTFFTVTKTKYLQMLTTLMRWVAFSAMIILSIRRILDSSMEHGNPGVLKLSSVPEVFGVSVYAFMCHHSIPSLISPVKDKRKLGVTLGLDYSLIAGFYLLLSLTGIFAFPDLPDLYTLAFKPDRNGGSIGVLDVVDYFLELFPVFTLSTNFPIIGITLRNNLESILTSIPTLRQMGIHKYRFVFPLLAIIPPALVALITENLGVLVTITGAYAGAGIQYLIPAGLVWTARRRLRKLEEVTNLTVPNPHKSVFSNPCFIFLILAWSAVAVGLVTANFVLNALED